MTEKQRIFYIFPTTNDKLASDSIMNRRVEAKRLKVKNNAFDLDALDFEILKILQEDARRTYTAIGKRLGIAHSTVYDRVKRMEKYGVIKRYIAIVDYRKAGAKRITAIMTVFTDPKESERVAEKLCGAPEVLEVYTSLSEELLIIAKVVAENQESLHAFIANSVAPLPGVLRIRTSMITRKFKEAQFSVTNPESYIYKKKI